MRHGLDHVASRTTHLHQAGSYNHDPNGAESAQRQVEDVLNRMEIFVSEQAQVAVRHHEERERGLQQLLGAARSAIAQLTQLQAAGAGNPQPALRDRRIRTQAPVPPFYWVPSPDYILQFEVTGEHGERVTKVGDFEDQGWVIPVSGTLRMVHGGLYRWTVEIVRKCTYRPQLQFGVHGLQHEKPWRLITTSRCSRSRDDEPWADRPGGDLCIREGDIIHVEVDMRALHEPMGSLCFAVNDGPYEVVFQDLPLEQPLIPVVSMGGDGSCVELKPAV